MNKVQYKDYIMSFRYVEYEEDNEAGGISLIIEGSILNNSCI